MKKLISSASGVRIVSRRTAESQLIGGMIWGLSSALHEATEIDRRTARRRFDGERRGMEIWGHATQNLAQCKVRVDDKGDIYAEAVDELIYGRLSNVLAA